ncbi:nicotinate-nucleotide adenylyltransferase [Wenxinia marina]|uniref:Probable nicotinate-nucleotide adenylyltransferase n=1 Tax=Wenxinia marina DSM 24838 TaxID=1123501 RepID=A0A0D0QA25_9RHOB|nr:nicotinate-nucleotide adenylyltransferase [Wenxinia marina]KIQ71299.1 nicotinate-nucleotide adenylyltransferase [Wenxinia marina DSM 24838]GGL73699.1 putative nicotinate-nucleotide adenylyltransferase [Wenxinia marina]
MTPLPVGRGRAVGLLGGSFDPPHAGHVAITLAALRRFALDEVWWVVSPGNPLKARGPAPLARRLAAAEALIDHPRVRISDIEARLGTRYTADTLAALRARRPDVRWVWLMGADNLKQLPQWDGWRRIMDHTPVGVLARPGERISARLSLAARVYARARLPASASRALPFADPPAWCFVNLPMSEASSTAIRAGGGWRHAADVTGSGD